MAKAPPQESVTTSWGLPTPFLDTSLPLVKKFLYRAVPHPFYYRRVKRRESLLTAFGIVCGCGVALLLLIFFIYVYFFD